MPRHNRRRDHQEPAAHAAANERREQWRGVDHVVRTVPGSAAVKTHRCPGCDHEIRPATAHVVTWPTGESDAANRRHWHTACWAARETRTPTRRG